MRMSDSEILVDEELFAVFRIWIMSCQIVARILLAVECARCCEHDRISSAATDLPHRSLSLPIDDEAYCGSRVIPCKQVQRTCGRVVESGDENYGGRMGLMGRRWIASSMR